MPALRILFAGTPPFAAEHLDALVTRSPHEVVAVLTQPDRPAGRGKQLQASAVKQSAIAAGLQVLQPATLRDSSTQDTLRALQADVMVVVAYGLILPQAVLDIPAHGCLNVHASLLPRWRGAAPIQRAVEAGDARSGITIMQMDAGLDTGAMLATAACDIGPAMTAGQLQDKLAGLGPNLLIEVLGDLSGYRRQAAVQDAALATYASKISKPEAAIDWSLPAVEIGRRIRAFNPFPVCYTSLDQQRLRIWQASVSATESRGKPPGTVIRAGEQGLTVACGTGSIVLSELQFPGGRRLPVSELLKSRANLLHEGARFGSAEN